MVKKGKAPPRREVTKRRLARWQQEKRRRRIIITLGTLVIALVLTIIGFGYYTTNVSLEDELLTTVGNTSGNTSFNGSDYVQALRLYPYSQGSPEAPLLILENNELVRQGAIAANISLTDDEVNLQERLDEYLRAQVPEVGAPVLQVYVQAIPVDSEEDAAVVMERLNASEDFASLAEEYGDGDLGWLPRGIMSPEFDEVAFSTPVGKVSEPFSTAEGYYIIKVLEQAERALDEDVREQLEANAFDYWLEAQREEKVERQVDAEELEEIYEWALKQIS